MPVGNRLQVRLHCCCEFEYQSDPGGKLGDAQSIEWQLTRTSKCPPAGQTCGGMGTTGIASLWAALDGDRWARGWSLLSSAPGDFGDFLKNASGCGEQKNTPKKDAEGEECKRHFVNAVMKV